MKKIFLYFLVSIFLSGTLFSQEVNSTDEAELDFDLPSQVLFQDTFRDSASSVVWSDWSILSFTRALALDKPILLNISVAWDESSYRMDTEVFSDPSVAYIINSLFVPIRVDGDKRPDIRDAYQAKIWPSIFFLLPNGEPIIWEKEEGETIPIALGYVNPNSIKTIAIRVYNYYKSERDKVIKLSSDLMKADEEKLKQSQDIFNEEIIDNTLSAIKGNFDLEYGGFGKEPKYPIPSAIELALLSYSLEKNFPLLEISSKTLKAIMLSEINDRVDGGLFRMAMKSDWSEPEHEKLLNRNAGVLSNLVDMYLVSGEEIYKEYALSIIDFINSNLLSQDGRFFAGRLDDFGIWDGYYDATEEEKKLLAKPGIDKVIFSNWNSITASAYIKASFAFNDASLLEKAKKNIHFILEKLHVPGRGVFHSYDNDRGELIGILEDQAYFCLALLDLYQSTGIELYLNKAQKLADFMIDNLEDKVEGGFFDFLKNDKAPGKLKLHIKSLKNNSPVARALIRLYYLTGSKKYQRKATRTLKLFSKSYLSYAILAAPYGSASFEFFNEPLKVMIVGRKDHPDFKKLISEGNRIPELWKIVKFVDIDKEDISEMGMDPKITPALYLIKEPLMSAPIKHVKRVIPSYKKFKKDLQSLKANEQDD